MERKTMVLIRPNFGDMKQAVYWCESFSVIDGSHIEMTGVRDERDNVHDEVSFPMTSLAFWTRTEVKGED